MTFICHKDLHLTLFHLDLIGNTNSSLLSCVTVGSRVIVGNKWLFNNSNTHPEVKLLFANRTRRRKVFERRPFYLWKVISIIFVWDQLDLVNRPQV